MRLWQELLKAFWSLRGLSQPADSAAEAVQDAIDAIALDVGRREVASWFEPADIVGTRLAGCRTAGGR